MEMLHVVGARPNFMKVAPVMAALGRGGIRQVLVHTGQHYDPGMSKIFFKQLEIPKPDINLEVGSASHAAQTAEIMIRFEPVVIERRPEVVLVYGDVNSTLAATLVCAKLLIPVGHVEAGVRSFDRSMPEEINRIVTDRLANLHFTPSADGNENLRHEGVPADKIHLVGNVMVDTLIRLLPLACDNGLTRELSLEGKPFVLVTLHRPSNVDDPSHLGEILRALAELAAEAHVIFPVHPRTRHVTNGLGNLNLPAHLHLTEPLGYLEFLSLQRAAALVITDSGGIQAETTYLGIPCLTARENTEWPITVDVGSNILVGRDMGLLKREARRALEGKGKKGAIPALWDGHASERIADILLNWTQIHADQR